MTTQAKIQLRGHCQICGSQQAVRKNGKGNIAHHGYRVLFASFHGTCGGSDFPPIEIDRSMLDKTVDYYSTDFIPMMEGELADVREIRGRYVEFSRISPEDLDASIPHPNGPVAFGDASDPLRLLDESERFLAAKAGAVRDYVAYLTRLADQHHGQPLVTVAPVTPPVLQVGERRYLPNLKSVVALVGTQGSQVVVTRDGSSSKVVVQRAKWDAGLDPSVVPEIKVGERRLIPGSLGGVYEATGIYGLDKVLAREIYRDGFPSSYSEKIPLKKWNAATIVG